MCRLVGWRFWNAKPAAFALSAGTTQDNVLLPFPITGWADVALEVARAGALWALNLFDSFDGAGSGAHMAVARGHSGGIHPRRTNRIDAILFTRPTAGARGRGVKTACA